MKLAFIAPLAVALAVAATPALAGQTKKHVTRSAAAEPTHVACTKAGCFPVAPNCTPHTQLNWRGNPTGYDQIVCR